MKLFKKIGKGLLVAALWIGVWFKKIGKGLAIAALWIGVWYAVWAIVGMPLLFPSPWAVLKKLFELMGTGAFYIATATSLWNVTKGLLIGIALGCLLSALTALVPLVGDFLRPFMTVVKTTPVASFIILLLLFAGAAKTPSLVTILIVLPIVWSNLDEGLRRIDPKLREVATVYRFPLKKRLTLLVFPSVRPYFSSALKSALGLAWKAGVAAEIIAMPKGTIGTQIGNAKLYLESTDLFAWTMTVILLSFAIEFALSKLLDRLFRTERRPSHASI